MKNVLYIDDIRMPEFWIGKDCIVTIARSYQEAIDLLDIEQYDAIDFNNDLGTEKEGYDIAKYILEKQIEVPEIYIHTMNPVAKQNISQLLEHNTKAQIFFY